MPVHDYDPQGGAVLPLAGPEPQASETPDTPVFRLATLDDAPAMLEVLEAAFDRWPEFDIDVTPLEHLQWKMQSFPDQPLSHTVGALDGRMVAASIRWARYVHVDGEELITGGGTDQAIHPDYQGRGFAALHRDSRSAFPIVGELGIGTESRHARLKNSRRRRPDSERALWYLKNWALNFDLRGAVGTGFRHSGVRGAVTALPAMMRSRRHNQPRPTASGLTIDPISQFDERADRLWERAREQFDVALVRRAAYLNWRYADPRSGRSQIAGAFEDDRLIGYAVVRPSGDRAVLADLFVEPGREDAAGALIRSAAASARAHGCRRLTAWLSDHHPLADTFQAAGFIDSGTETRISFHQPRGSTTPVDLDRLRDPALRIHIMMGDQDFV